MPFQIQVCSLFFRANNSFNSLIPFFLFNTLRPFNFGGSLTVRQTILGIHVFVFVFWLTKHLNQLKHICVPVNLPRIKYVLDIKSCTYLGPIN